MSPTPAGPSPSRAGTRARSRRGFWLVLGLGATGVLLGLWLVITLVPRWFGSTAGGGATPADSTAAATRKIHATLFYVSEDGSELVPVSREVPLGSTPSEQARRMVEAQLQPAPEGFTSAIPDRTSLRTVYLTAKGEAFVDLSHDIITGHSGGSLDETLTVFAIVDALTVNLPDVQSVQILVDGKEVETIAGHVDVRHPLGRSLKWVKRLQ